MEPIERLFWWNDGAGECFGHHAPIIMETTALPTGNWESREHSGYNGVCCRVLQPRLTKL